MSTDLQLLPEHISPEGLEVAEAYITMGHDTRAAADMLGLPVEAVQTMLNKREVKEYLNHMFMESGFRNREKMFGIMDEIIRLKLEELQESGMGSSADILEIMKVFHKMKMDEYKMAIELKKAETASSPTNQTNIQNNLTIPGGNDPKFMSLVSVLMDGKKK